MNITILPADKGNAMVVLNTSDYKQKISSLLQDPAYRKLTKDPTDSVEWKTTPLLKKSSLTEETHRQLGPACSRPPRLYRLPKIHKEGVPLRPIVSNIVAPPYQLSKHISGLLKQHTGKTAHHVKNSFHFIRILESLTIKPGDLMVSFDMVSLFIKVPVEEPLTLLSQHFSDDILALYKHVLTSTYFCVDGQFYEQTDGVAMGSPLEMKTIKKATPRPACWYRYVDDTFVIWPHGKEKLMDFLNHLNGIHNNIQFTVEIEDEGHLPFRDTDIYRKMDGSLGYRVYQKPTHTNLYLHQKSHHHLANKHSVLSSLVQRATALCDQESVASELPFLTHVFKQNGYSHQLI